ncbi:uncharacterized protein BDW47DRAFT_128153 [Aspergillus candidus]|uniref:Uncharacterized protein n=1 Tax=Aspergillus candidus TaxID=41067 RepID=A0A2I2F3Z4_ASPCN|nr:hypothetical protein BDW47DRAFT_128153 [Aspergillus candidus]PLB35355.1 hypothetical protein BDW47DRAFT_128153 [Aspergillus candidus]
MAADKPTEVQERLPMELIQHILTMIPAFEEVAVSDPDWVSLFTIMDNGLDEGALEHHLSFGLAHIQRFTQAKDAQWTLEEFDSEDEAELIPTPWFSDPDRGPEDV